jgi:hypothetical protein
MHRGNPHGRYSLRKDAGILARVCVVDSGAYSYRTCPKPGPKRVLHSQDCTELHKIGAVSGHSGAGARHKSLQNVFVCL